MEKWMNDDHFRSTLRKDPEGTIRATGMEFTPEQWRAFHDIDWSLSDEELTARASAQGTGCVFACC